jgi:SAM-dependent methyltransferase
VLAVATESKPAACPGCAATETSELFHSGNGFPILRCGACGLAFTEASKAPPPSALYPPFEQSESALQTGLRRSLAVFLRRRAAIVRAMKPSGRVLDFGCGSGAFAKWMRDEGYESVGLEPFSLGQPVESERLKLVRQPLESAGPALGTFDVVTAWHVLEHVADPAELLQQLRQRLSPGGVLIVSVPNLASWQGHLFGPSWFHLDPPRHLLHFEPQTLDAYLERAGLRPVKRWDLMLEYGLSGWLQSSLNQVLAHKNYLYELIKDRGALARLRPTEHALYASLSALLGAPTLALSLPLEAIASALGGGAALTVAAVATA